MFAPTSRTPICSPACWAVLAAFTLTALLLAANIPLIDPDEGRNAEVMREVLETHDPVIPHLAGMPYLDKPPALFWAGALSVSLFGRTPLAARLPSLLAALATLLVLAWTLRRLGLAARGPMLLALLAGSPLYLVLSAYVIFDMPLTACVTGFWALNAVEIETAPSSRRRLGMFAALALGVLCKGPVMLAWALGGSAAAALLMRSRRPLAWSAWAPGWLVVLALAGGWFALALARHPEYARYAFLEESLERMTRGSFKREQPLWFAPAVIAGGALPWSLVTPWRRPASRTTLLAVGFVMFAVVFFTLSRSKLVTYLLPALPALAWWAAESWSVERDGRRAAAMLTVLLALLSGGLLFFGSRGVGAGVTGVAPLAGGLLAAGAACGLLAPLALAGAVVRRPWLALGTACAFAPTVLALSGSALVSHARGESGAPLALALRAAGADTIVYLNCYSPGTDFLLGRRGLIVSSTGHELTSNYIVRYRDRLRSRGQWTLIDPTPRLPRADAIIVPAAATRFELSHAFHVDRRFAAFRPERAGSTPP